MGESIVKEMQKDYNLSEEQVYDLLNEYISYILANNSSVTNERKMLYDVIKEKCLKCYF